MPLFIFHPKLASSLAGALEGFPKCRLQYEYPISLPHSTVAVQRVIHKGTHSIAYYANCMDEERTKVVLKFAPIEGLLKEATMYDSLGAIQGKCIPKFYGMFFGRSIHGRERACIVLEYAGEPLDTLFERLPKADKAIILSHLAEIHKRGWEPLDFAERNTLKYGDEYRLIDFEHVNRPHKCTWNYNFFDAGEYDYGEPGVTCNSLWVAAEDMLFWNRGIISAGQWGFVQDGSLPSQDIVNQLPLEIDPNVYASVALQWADRYYTRVKEELDNNVSIEELRGKQPEMLRQIVNEYKESTGQPESSWQRWEVPQCY